jgi:hypothetical protein
MALGFCEKPRRMRVAMVSLKIDTQLFGMVGKHVARAVRTKS